MIVYDPFIVWGVDSDQPGHPMLPAGYDSVPMNADEVNGAGLNEVRVPVTYASDEVLPLLVLSSVDFEVFECVSAAIPFENRTVNIQHENRTVQVIRRCA